MLNRTLLLASLCICALPLAGCKPDDALKRGEVIDRNATPITPDQSRQTVPVNHPHEGIVAPVGK